MLAHKTLRKPWRREQIARHNRITLLRVPFAGPCSLLPARLISGRCGRRGHYVVLACYPYHARGRQFHLAANLRANVGEESAT